MSDRQMIEVRGFKWPRRPTGTTMVSFLGEDAFGRWLSIRQGDPWWPADRASAGVFESSFVKLVPQGTFWTACFNDSDPVIDVDIVLPVHWADDVLEEVDLELDVLRFTDGTVQVRDVDAFAQVRQTWPMPEEFATRAEDTCMQIRMVVERGAEPFGDVGRGWLDQFLVQVHSPGCR